VQHNVRYLTIHIIETLPFPFEVKCVLSLIFNNKLAKSHQMEVKKDER
jgi:hypothetical protein